MTIVGPMRAKRKKNRNAAFPCFSAKKKSKNNPVFLMRYQGRYTSVEDDVSKLRRKPLKKDTVADAERESQSSGLAHLRSCIHGPGSSVQRRQI